jgi:hypothetical protein
MCTEIAQRGAVSSVWIMYLRARKRVLGIHIGNVPVREKSSVPKKRKSGSG